MAERAKKASPESDKRLAVIGAKLRALRKAKGYKSSEKFAFDHDLPRVGYGNHEQGANLTMTSLLRLLDIHGLTLHEFFSDTE